MNESNPIIDSRQLAKESRKKEYPVKVYCVVWNYSDSNSNALIKSIKDHTHESGAMFITRIYDSFKYSDDRYQIQRLPAFHIYINGGYNRTFYPNTRPLQHIDESIGICIKKEENKIKRKEKWSRMYRRFVELMRRLVHRETRMEQYERENKIKTISEWN